MAHYRAFSVSKMTSEFGLSFVDLCSLKKGVRLGFLFLILFSLLKIINKNK